jgi:peptidoglycan/LPS O-acetylase OafA/YrhL
MGFLRMILALGVIFYHIEEGSFFGYVGIDGFVAVHIFFIISGFYMALIIKNKYSKTKRPYYNFITNRFLRIYPVYWVVLVLAIFISYSQFGNPLINYVRLMGFKGIIEDITLLIRGDYLNVYMFTTALTVAPAWTLVTELIFYLSAPFLLFLKKRYLLILGVLSLLMYVFVTHDYSGSNFSIKSYSIPANFYLFIMGIFSYYWYEKIKKYKIKYSFFLSVLFLIFVVYWSYLPEITFGWILIKEWLIYLLTPLIIPLLFKSFDSVPLNNFMADLSYPTYISHMLSIDFLQTILNYRNTWKFFSYSTVLITFVISVALVYLVERPLNRIRQSRVK